MANAYTQVVNLPRLVAQSTGTGGVTNGIGSLDDANSITIFLRSSGGWNPAALAIQISQFDPAIADPVGVTQSTAWHTSTGLNFVATTSGQAITISPISFRGLRIANTSSAATSEVVAYVSKQITV